jgi:hypothetical protein
MPSLSSGIVLLSGESSRTGKRRLITPFLAFTGLKEFDQTGTFMYNVSSVVEYAQ